MSEEKPLEEPELYLSATVYIDRKTGQPRMKLYKDLHAKEKIRLLSNLILREEYLPCRILVEDKLLFYSKLKELGLL